MVVNEIELGRAAAMCSVQGGQAAAAVGDGFGWRYAARMSQHGSVLARLSRSQPRESSFRHTHLALPHRRICIR